MKRLLSFVVISLFATAIAISCDRESKLVDDMSNEIDACEAYLNSLDADMPFMDTVGESDDYSYLCEWYGKFKDAEVDLNTDKMYEAFVQYQKYFHKCVEQAIEIKESIEINRIKNEENEKVSRL